MAKRARGSVRPGQRRPIERRPATPPSAGRAAAAPGDAATGPAPALRHVGLTEAEAARAAELEQQLLAQERQAEAARSRARERATRDVAPSGGASLAVRAEQEYAYVARDVRRIAEMAVLMLAILFGLWFLVDVAKVVTIS